MFKFILLSMLIICSASIAAPVNDFTFKSPAFTGIGYGPHVLTIENQEFTRKKNIEDKLFAALAKEAAEAKNTNLQKFLNNLESRIYAQISQNLATAMFANGGTSNGTLNFEGNVIHWIKDVDSITLTVTDLVGNTTTIEIPLGQFTF